MFHKASVVTALVSSLAVAVSAQADTGFYVGGSVGQTTVKDSQRVSDGESTQTIHFDEDDTSYKIYGGYMFLPFLGVEGGYTNFGNPSKTFRNTAIGNVNAEVEVDGWEAFVVGDLPLGPIDLFAKAGVLSYDIDLKIKAGGNNLGSGSDSDEIGAYGIGAAVGLGGGVKVRAEYTYYDSSNVDDLYMYSVGATFSF